MVTDATNQMLIQNAETLKDATITSAKEYERGIIDMETLKKTQTSLITTIDEVIKIQDDGRAKRREAEAELKRLEDELRQKIMAAATRTSSEKATYASVPEAKEVSFMSESEPAPEAEVKLMSEDPFGLHGDE